jgi:hypothetical protein
MKTSIKSLTASILAGMAFITLCGTARADLTLSTNSNSSAWVGNPFYATSLGNGLTGFTTQGMVAPGNGASYSVLSETFTITNNAGESGNGGVQLTSAAASSNYVLTAISVIGSGGGGGGGGAVQVHLFDVTTNLTSNNGNRYNGSGATYNFTANGDLFGNGNGLTFTNANAGEKQIILSLLNGPSSQDQIVLGSNHTYAVEFWAPAANLGFFYWMRNSLVDLYGQGMGSTDGSLTVARLTLTSLGTAGGAPRTFSVAFYGTPTLAAPTVNTNLTALTNYIIDQFNSWGYGAANQYVGTNDYSTGGLCYLWTNWNNYGTAWVTNQWDPSNDANNDPNSGSLKIIAQFPGQFAVYDGWYGISPPLSCFSNGITRFECDLRFDPSSPTTTNSSSGLANYGHLQIGTRTNIGTGQDYWSSIEIGVGTNGWVHETIPLNLSSDNNLFSINDVVFHIDGNWYPSHPLNGTTILWVDNIKFVGPATVILPPPPTLTIQKTTPGLRIFAGSAGQNDRTELATVDQNQSWIGGSYPVTYSFTLLSYPTSINQTHIFLVPMASVPANQNMYNNEYVEYQASNALWLDIQPYPPNGAFASVRWKTNLPNANPDKIQNVLTNTTAVGTWTLTFTGTGAGTVTAPGGSPVAFTIGDPNVLTDFANPLVAYFGLQPNSGTGVGQYEDWGSITVTGVAGAKENDIFTADTSFNTALWSINTLTVALNTSVQLVTPSTPYWVSWTLPAVNYGLGTAMDIRGNTNTIINNTLYPWVLPEYYYDYTDGMNIPGQANQGNRAWVLVPTSCLPTVNGLMYDSGGQPAPNGFFRLFNPSLSN